MMERIRMVYIAHDMENFIDNSIDGIALSLYDEELKLFLEICNREGLDILITPARQEGE